jgi:hypothetical protein
MLTSGVSALGPNESINPFAQVATVFSGADPAMADLAGTSAIAQGSYPQSANQAIAASWLTANPWTTATPSASLASGGQSGATNAPPTVSTMTTVAVFVIAIVLLMAGAFALVGPETAAAVGG